MRDRLAYETRQLISTVAAFLVSAAPAVITALVVYKDVKLPESEVPMTPGKMVSVTTVISLVVVGIVVAVAAWRTIISFMRRHMGYVSVIGIAAVYGIISLLQKYEVLLEPTKKVFEVWMWSSAAAILVSLALNVYLGIGWRVGHGRRAGESAAPEHGGD